MIEDESFPVMAIQKKRSFIDRRRNRNRPARLAKFGQVPGQKQDGLMQVMSQASQNLQKTIQQARAVVLAAGQSVATGSRRLEVARKASRAGPVRNPQGGAKSPDAIVSSAEIVVLEALKSISQSSARDVTFNPSASGQGRC